jgi:hypothetical protein
VAIKHHPDKYLGNFCIIPRQILIDKGNFETDISSGKQSIGISPPDYPKPHWSKPYWNNVQQFLDYLKPEESPQKKIKITSRSNNSSSSASSNQ